MLFYFDIAAIPIYIIIFISIFLRNLTKGISNITFIVLVTVSFFTTVADLISAVVLNNLPLSEMNLLLAYFFTYIYFILRNATGLIYLFFIFSMTRTWYRIQKNIYKLIISLPYILSLTILFLNLKTDSVFTITRDLGYQRGEHMMILYTISIIYIIAGTIYLIFCRSLLSFIKLFLLIFMYIVSVVSILIQFYIPDYLIEMFFMSIVFFLMILLVKRPEEIIDTTVGIASYKSYKEEIDKILKANQKVQVHIINFVNSGEIRTFLGEERYTAHIKNLYKTIDTICKSEKLGSEIYFGHPGCFYIISDRWDYKFEDVINTLYPEFERKLTDIEKVGVKFLPKICLLKIPENLNDYSEIIHFGHIFYKIFQEDDTFIIAKDVINQKNFEIEINLDNILNRSIIKKSFEMYYQPIYSLKDKRFISAEALIRLKDDKFGFISPSMFIPAAEQKGIMHIIGDFVMDSVYRFISENDFEDLGLSYIEINLSVAQCLQKDLPQKIQKLHKKYGVSVDKVNFEITETTFESIGEVVENNVKILSQNGHILTMDDYGTGYSNIQRIFKLPLKMIKIDKSLVDNIHTIEGMSVMKNTIRMMKDINMQLVIEGVEDKATLKKLEKMDCDFIQGFYFSKPLPEKEFIKFIKLNQGNCNYVNLKLMEV